ncbi:hypothetical protein BHU62_00390 [Serratia marcescens]|uniref:Uncharacterized protein n=1 Tax=Serratia marcescens TaxID=615 RepID=A0A1Q4P609_SERMA|nr:hypothetical protein [Serratia marcescens]OKB68539.1 hypothetical protein BHU62_00390 [Serratia marcescens]
MKSGAIRHLVRRAAGCLLFFGLVAPPLGGVLMFLLMVFGTGELVELGRLEAGDTLGMVAFIGAFSYVLGFLPACLVGAIVGIAHPGIRRLRWFLLLCAVLSAVAPGLLNADQRIFGTIAVLPGTIAGFLWWRRRLRDVPHDDVLHGTPSS